MISIEAAKKNTFIAIEKIAGGEGIRQKLQGMGIREGDKVFILQDYKSGPLIIIKEGIKIALGKGIAKKIFIQESKND